ncbi:hypothetical protein D3C78_1579540 [compost metagenome]
MSAGPLAELHAAWRAHTVADGQDQVEVVQLGPVSLAVRGSCQGFLDNCLLQKLPILENVLSVQGHVLLGGLEQLGNFQLA